MKADIQLTVETFPDMDLHPVVYVLRDPDANQRLHPALLHDLHHAGVNDSDARVALLVIERWIGRYAEGKN